MPGTHRNCETPWHAMWPPAAAFLGALHSYVFLSEIAGAFEEDVPMDRFLGTVLDVWSRGTTPTREPKKQRQR